MLNNMGTPALSHAFPLFSLNDSSFLVAAPQPHGILPLAVEHKRAAISHTENKKNVLPS